MKNKESFFKAILQVLITGHRLTEQVNQALKPYKISEPQYNVLRILRGQKGNPIAVQNIQSRMIQRSSNVTRIVDKLLEKGLVNRTICPENRRKMNVTITQKGQELLLHLDGVLSEMHEPLMNKLTQEESETLANILNKLQ